jgi:hypothetical protein
VDHTWVSQNNWGYQSFISLAALDSAYRALIRELKVLATEGLSAAVYTQTTDVETEVNGLLTYDRAVTKISSRAIEDNKSVYGPLAARRAIVATSLGSGQSWRYTIEAPSDSTWTRPDFDDSNWQVGSGGFGHHTPNAGAMPVHPRTPWSSTSIWMRRTFQLPAANLTDPQWRIYHAGDVDVYLNGTHVASFTRATNTYVSVPLTPTARVALLPGANTIAVQVRLPQRFQFIDVGIEDMPAVAKP